MSPRFPLLILATASLLFAIDPDRDFSGKWILTSGTRLSVPFEPLLTIEQGESEIRCSFDDAHWTYALNGTERKVQIGGETRNSLVKWEGAALLINTIVSGAHDYVVMDRWRLSRDHANLTVTRQIIRGVKQEEGSMVYRRDTPASAAAPPAPAPVERPREAPSSYPAPIVRPGPPAATPPPPPALARRESAPPLPSEVILRAGTHIPLTFRNTVDTKHSHEGTHIYLETAFPVAQDGLVIIPRGSFVNGVITQIKPPGHTGKGEMSIRFDMLALPNGVKRDLQSRLASGDEGKVEGEPDRGAEARKVGGAAGTGAGGGVMTGSAAGHPGVGAGIGGATAGIASVLLSRGADASLPQGTTVDMVLDRDLRFRAEELR